MRKVEVCRGMNACGEQNFTVRKSSVLLYFSAFSESGVQITSVCVSVLVPELVLQAIRTVLWWP